MVPGIDRCKQPILIGFALAVAGCGASKPALETVHGRDYAFSAPATWTVVRGPRAVEASSGVRLVSVTRFALLRRFRPDLWAAVVPEIDRSAETLAGQQHGAVTSRATATIAGLQARRYEVAYERRGKRLVELLGFVLRGKTEYQLLCRYERGQSSSACDTLLRTFKLT